MTDHRTKRLRQSSFLPEWFDDKPVLRRLTTGFATVMGLWFLIYYAVWLLVATGVARPERPAFYDERIRERNLSYGHQAWPIYDEKGAAAVVDVPRNIILVMSPPEGLQIRKLVFQASGMDVTVSAGLGGSVILKLDVESNRVYLVDPELKVGWFLLKAGGAEAIRDRMERLGWDGETIDSVWDAVSIYVMDGKDGTTLDPEKQ
jgi:hypothetical protein